MAQGPLSFRRRLAVVGAGVSLLETFAVAAPLYVYIDTGGERPLVDRLVPIVVVAGWLAWWVAMRTWRGPLDRAVRARRARADATLTRDDAEAAYHAILTLPRRVAWLRAGLAGVLGALVGLLLYRRGAIDGEAVLTIVVVATVHTLFAEFLRMLGWSRALLRLRATLLPDVDPLRLLRDDLGPRLVNGALAPGALGATAIAAFTWYFLPIPVAAYVNLETWFPFTILALTAVWIPLLRRLVRPIDAYLVAATSPDPRTQPAGDDPRALVAYRAAQSLPYKLAVAKVGFWLAGAALLVAQAVMVFHVDVESSVLIFAAALLVTVGVAIYEALWHRATVRPLLAHLATRHRPRPETVRTPLSLRNKMLVSFGSLTFFACGLSLFWSFVQYKNLATGFIHEATDLRLGRLVADLAGLAARHAGPLAPVDVERMLAAGGRDEGIVYYLPPGPGAAPIGYGGGDKNPAPPLDGDTVALLRRSNGSAIEVPALHLTGASARLVDPQGHDLGAVAVLHAGYLGRGPTLDRPIKVLVFFFLLLAVASMGIVVLVTADLTAPIRLLERRAGAMAQGDLSRPVVHVAGEADEVGRLTFAFEEMRHALNDKLRSSTEINLHLEAEVRRRTAELERRNKELRDALDALQRTQDELVRAEKMSSLGRLVAGIAHEINNPVNALVNTAGPLGLALDELTARLTHTVGQNALGPDDARALADELRAMLAVIQRGARRTKEIVQALHNYSRGDDSRAVDVDLEAGIDESLELLRHQLRAGISVERIYGSVGKVRGYAGQLHQVFMNLVTNAAQALVEKAEKDPSAPPGSIRIATARQSGAVVVTVEDNGPGIPPDVLPRIFDPFFTTKEVGKGSGLGLSIVHGIVERHGGTIAVDTQVGRGTRFIVTLPIDGDRARASA